MFRTVIIALIKIYQWTVSPLLGNCCRFYPTCSKYSVEAFKQHGVMKGGFLTMKRILRCHPFNPGGYDPVVSKNER